MRNMCSVVADHDQAMQPVDAGDDGDSASRLLRVAALSVSAIMACFRNGFADQISLAHGTLSELIAAGTAKGDDERGNAAMVKLERVVEPCAVNEQAVINSAAPRTPDGVGRGSLILIRVDLNLHVDPAAPPQSCGQQARSDNEKRDA